MSYTREEFTKEYGSFIARQVKGTGILAGTLISQAIIESQGEVNGNYRVGASKLSQKANNYFGIKCYGGWRGKTYNIDTQEESKGGSSYTDSNACFRSYSSVKDSIKDYIKFLEENPRYKDAGVFEAKTVKEQAQALKNGGYATSSNYVNMIDSVYNGIKPYVEKYAITTTDKIVEKITGKDKTEYELSKKKKDSTKLIGLSLVAVITITLGALAYMNIKSKK